MEITLLYFDDCPNWKVAAERLAAVTVGRPDISVLHHLVESMEEAERLGFHGSPSILINGVDVFAEAGTGVGLSCRLYQTPDGSAGAPTIAQLREAIAAT